MNSENNILRSCQKTLLKGFGPREYSPAREVRVFSIWFSLFILTAFVLLVFNPDQGLHTNVGFHVFHQIFDQIANGNPVFGVGVNWLIYGSTDFVIKGALLPAYVISSFFSDEMVPVIAFTVFSAEMFISVYISCRLFRFPPHAALIAAWLAALLYMPFVYPRVVLIEIMIVASCWSTLAGLFIMSISLFYRLGKFGIRDSLLVSSGLFLIASYITLAFLQYVVVYGYNIFWACLPLFLFASTLKERVVKVVAGLIMVAVYYVLFYDFLSAYYGYNWGDIIQGQERSGLTFVRDIWGAIVATFSSIDGLLYRFQWIWVPIYHNGQSNSFTLFFVYASLTSGFFYVVFFVNKTSSNLFNLSAAFLSAMFGTLLYGSGYHEVMISSLYLISFVLGVLGAATVLAHGLKHVLLSAGLTERLVTNGAMLVTGFRADDPKTPTGPVLTVRGATMIFMGVLFVFFYAYRIGITPDQYNLFVYGKRPDMESYRILERGIGINSSPVFRGRFANAAILEKKTAKERLSQRFPNPRDPSGKPILSDFLNLKLEADQLIAYKTGGADFRRSMSHDRIPMLHDNNRFTGPGIGVIERFFLSGPHDLTYVMLHNISKFDKRIMEMLGIRFFMFHEPLPKQPGVTLRGTEVISKRLTVYLYELADPSVGNYSPTEQVVHSSAKEALDIIGNSTFDFRKSMLVRKRIPGTLVPAKASKVKIIGDRLEVEAESDGRSLIVLPFEYSHCLSVENKPGWTAKAPELVRVNLDQIGLLFEGGIKANIKFLFDPFNSECRVLDRQDWKEMKIRELLVYKGVNVFGFVL